MKENKENKEKHEKFMSFSAWKDFGFTVIKGEKSSFRSPDGIPLFNESQVTEIDDDNLDLSHCDLY